RDRWDRRPPGYRLPRGFEPATPAHADHASSSRIATGCEYALPAIDPLDTQGAHTCVRARRGRDTRAPASRAAHRDWCRIVDAARTPASRAGRARVRATPRAGCAAGADREQAGRQCALVDPRVTRGWRLPAGATNRFWPCEHSRYCLPRPGLHELQQVSTIAAFFEALTRLSQIVIFDEPHAPCDLFGACHFESLPLFQHPDEHRSVEQRRMRPGIQPCRTATQDLYVQVAPLEVAIIDVRDLEFASGRWADAPGDLDDVIV